MVGEKLSKEAEEFIKDKTTKLNTADRTALRFYFGTALGGLLADRDSRQRPLEIVAEAFEYAKMAKKWEDDKF